MKKLQNTLIEIRLTEKQMARLSVKCEKDEKQNLKKCKEYLKQGQVEPAKIYAENAIRNRNEAQKYLKVSARLKAVESRVQSAITAQQMSAQMGKVVKGLDSVLSTMNVEKISAVMEQFEEDSETVDVRTQFITNSIASGVASSTPEGQVTALMQQVGEEIGLQVSADLSQVIPSATPEKQAEAQQQQMSQKIAS